MKADGLLLRSGAVAREASGIWGDADTFHGEHSVQHAAVLCEGERIREQIREGHARISIIDGRYGTL
jgi:hypothetical protein